MRGHLYDRMGNYFAFWRNPWRAYMSDEVPGKIFRILEELNIYILCYNKVV
jgi:hypothetical protein